MTEKIFITLMLVALMSVTESVVTDDQCLLLCTKIGFPVCGSDGRTYGNPCELRAGNCLKSPDRQVTLVRNGTCDSTSTYLQPVPDPTPKECTLACTADYTPVCGSDGNTYGNDCKLRVRNCQGSPYDQVTIVSRGACETTTTTTTTTVKYPAPGPVTPEPCSLRCTREYAPVCGSDGRNYSTACVLRAENCVRSPYQQVTIVRNGTCDATTTTYYPTPVPDPTPKTCSLACTEDYTPVCGSDGESYSNACQLRVRNCKGSPYDQITIVSQGTCGSITTTLAAKYPTL